ncbi:MAG: hypothetical protein DMG58_11885 [Acidobacteria bacterium]|nr:MAG: hypothetical protein DMG58_11885 [Acidobacteriota bacterium]
MPSNKKRWISVGLPLSAALAFSLFVPQRSQAIPAFARKYNVKCYACHIMPPALNKNGYMFKRLGYRMPPDEMDGTKPAPKVRELDSDIKWTITNAFALVTQGSFTQDKTTGDQTASNTSFNLDKALLFTGGSIPQTPFDYFVEFKLYEDGESAIEQAILAYTGGRANSSYFGKAGMMHVQEGDGTRAASLFSLFPDPAFTLINTSPINFTLDQHPVGINAGYTWASPYFKQVLGIQAKVTNGVNADGSEIIGGSNKNGKDFWMDADYLFGPDGGLTFLSYYGHKNQIQNEGGPDEFTYYPTIRRNGIFGNYLFFDRLDVLGGYIRAQDDWKLAVDGSTGKYTSNGLRGEVDYYIQRGFALMARYDRLNQNTTGTGRTHASAWGVGAQKALTQLGNVIIRGSYNHERDQDPVSGAVSTNKLFMLDLRIMW